MANLKIHESQVDKVIQSIAMSESDDLKKELYYNWKMPELSPDLRPKIHQIVIGSNSWCSGKSIHFLDGLNIIFCPSVPAQAVQECKITFKKGAISIRIDDRTLQKTEVLEFIKNEGYADLKEFKEAYFKAYTDDHHKTIVRKCTLIHWTKLFY